MPSTATRRVAASSSLKPSSLSTRFARQSFSARDSFFSVDRKSTRLNSSHDQISYAVFCLKKKKTQAIWRSDRTRTDHNRLPDNVYRLLLPLRPQYHFGFTLASLVSYARRHASRRAEQRW